MRELAPRLATLVALGSLPAVPALESVLSFTLISLPAAEA